MIDADLLRRATANFPHWQGLRIVPIGAFLAAFSSASLVTEDWAGRSTVIILAAVFLVLAARRIETYYDRTFGQVREIPIRRAARWTVRWLLLLPLAATTALVDINMAWPVAVSGLAWAVAILVCWATTGYGRRHWLIGAAFMGGASAAPAAGVVSPGRPAVYLLLLVLGIVYMICGILDHMVLNRAFPRYQILP